MVKIPPVIKISEQVSYRVDTDCWIHSGYCNEQQRVIGVKQAGEYRMHETLLHEILHACEKQLMADGKINAESTESYIEGMGVLLFHALVKSGLYNLRENPEWYQETLDFDEREENRSDG